MHWYVTVCLFKLIVGSGGIGLDLGLFFLLYFALFSFLDLDFFFLSPPSLLFGAPLLSGMGTKMIGQIRVDQVHGLWKEKDEPVVLVSARCGP